MDSKQHHFIQNQQIPGQLHGQTSILPAQIRNSCSFKKLHKSPLNPYPEALYQKTYFLNRTTSAPRISQQKTKQHQKQCGLVKDGFEQLFKFYNHHQKIACLINVVQMYRKLVSKHGLFLLTRDCLRVDCLRRPVVLFCQKRSARLPRFLLKYNKSDQQKVILSFLDLFRKQFSQIFFKYAKIRTLQDLQNFFFSVQRKNQIHKRCKVIVRQRSKSRAKSYKSVKDGTSGMSASKRFDLLQRPVSYFGVLQPKSNLSVSMSTKQFLSTIEEKERVMKRQDESSQKSLLDTTNMSNSHSRQNKSQFQIQNLGKESDIKRKSCILKTSQSQNCLWHLYYAKQKSMVSRHKQSIQQTITLAQKQDRRAPQSIVSNSQEEVEDKMKNSLSLCFQGLLLSQVVQDVQNEVLHSGGGNRQIESFMKDFENVLY